MQKENEKIPRIMAEDDSCNSNINSLIEKLKYDVITESNDHMQVSRKLPIQSINNEIVKENVQDIEDEITELENLIKKLQAEIVEMSETAHRPLPVSFCQFISSGKEGGCCNNSTNHASPEIINELKQPEMDAGFGKISKDDGLLEDVKMFAESLSNIMNSSNITNDQKDALNDVKWNFSALFDDASKSNKSNLEIAEKTIEDISSKLSKAFDYCIMHSSLETDKSVYKNTAIESATESSINSTSDRAEISRCENVSEFFADDMCSNDKDTVNDDTLDDGKKTMSDIKLPEDSTGNDDNSRIININVTDKIISNVPLLLNTETLHNLLNSNMSVRTDEVIIEDARIPGETIKDLPISDTVEALKETILKTSENALSDKTGTPESSLVFSLQTPTDIPATSSQSITRENAIPKTDSILKCINRKIRKIVGIDSEKSISKDRNNTEKTSKEFLKAFPRSKSESKRDDSFPNNQVNKVIVLTQESLKNVSKDFSVPFNESKTSHPETNSINATVSSNNTKNIAKQMIPQYISDLKINKSESGYPLDSASTPPRDSQNQSFVQANLTTTENTLLRINSPNGPQIINTDNIIDNPDITKKNLEQGLDISASTNGGTGSIIPNVFDSNLPIEEQEKSIMKAEVVSDQEKKEEEEDAEAKTLLSALENEQDDYEETEERDDDEDDDTSAYDVD